MPGPKTPSNPLETARRLTAPVRPRRFYEKAEMREEAGGLALHLDGKRALTPGRNPLVVPRQDIAEAIAAEWERQAALIDPASMAVTRLANSAIDGVAPRQADVRNAIHAYANADLLYYRAGEPEGLVARQREIWDPILAWAEQRFGARFVLAQGVVHVDQPKATLEVIAAAVESYDEPFRLTGLNLATTLTGSALIALALAEAFLDAENAWLAAHVDEDWNISQWGEDAEARERRARRFEDFKAAALALGRSS